ncbi:MAG: nucleotidyltransferase domain-containing protein [Deltaproteobacteria bacterium]|nr:nucleotidyltransferase domain-containing protein [Deltaproteobacteria bacterium]
MGKPHQGDSGLAGALFSSTQQRLLGLLFGQPERSFFTSELISMVGVGSGSVQRVLERWSRSGLLRVHRVGTQKHYQADPSSPIFEELRSIARKTLGPATELRAALSTLESEIRLALLYGSLARGEDRAASDIDLLVVSDGLTLEALFSVLAPVEARLGRSVSPTLYTLAEFRSRRAAGKAFLTRVLSGETIPLIGEPDDLDEQR